MNEEIEKLFAGFTVDGAEIPVCFMRYRGDQTTYITYQEIGDDPALCGDDECLYSIKQYDFDIYSKGNYLNILSAVKERLKAGGFTWTGDSADMYEDDTGYNHKTTTFEKESING